MLTEQKQILFLCFLLLNRLCLQYAEDQHSLDSSNRYNGMLDALRKIYKTEGFRGLYRVSIRVFTNLFFLIILLVFIPLVEKRGNVLIVFSFFDSIFVSFVVGICTRTARSVSWCLAIYDLRRDEDLL